MVLIIDERPNRVVKSADMYTTTPLCFNKGKAEQVCALLTEWGVKP